MSFSEPSHIDIVLKMTFIPPVIAVLFHLFGEPAENAMLVVVGQDPAVVVLRKQLLEGEVWIGGDAVSLQLFRTVEGEVRAVFDTRSRSSRIPSTIYL